MRNANVTVYQTEQVLPMIIGQVEAIHSTEFSGKPTCEAAAKQLAKDGVLKTTCVPK